MFEKKKSLNHFKVKKLYSQIDKGLCVDFLLLLLSEKLIFAYTALLSGYIINKDAKIFANRLVAND